mgnify:CR=1 FL=1
MSAATVQARLFGEAAAPVAPSSVVLRPYQTSAIEWVASERGPGERLLLVSPTGSGKTFTAARVILDEIASGGRVIFAAHRQELITQTYGSLLRLGLPEPLMGVIMGDGIITHPITRRRSNCSRPLAPVQVASIDTLRQPGRAKPRDVSLVFYDECHRALSRSYVDLAEHYAQATVVGLTATPWRGDGRGLGTLFRKLFVVATPRVLMDEGHLVEPRVFSHPHRADLKHVKITAGDYNEKQLAEACDRRELLGSIVEHWRRHLDGRRTVAFAVNVEHSKHIVEEFLAAGISAEHLDGTTPDDDRAAILGRLASGETLVVSNCAVLCLDEKTEILTSSGWVGIDAMTPEHLVANWDDGAVTFERPIEVIRRDRAPGERMVYAKGTRADARVTEGHALLHRTKRDGKFRKSPARDVVNRAVEVPVAGVAAPSEFPAVAATVDGRKRQRLINVNSYSLRQREGYDHDASIAEATRRVDRKLSLRHKAPHELTLDECRFIGFWIGDGSRTELPRGGVEYIVAQSHAYPKIIEWLDEVIARIGVHCSRRTEPPAKGAFPSPHPSRRWSFPRGTGGGSQEREGLYAIEPYLDKNGSPLLWGLDEDRFDALIEGLWMADGDHRDGSQKPARRAFRIHNTNRALIDALQAIASARGYATAVIAGFNRRKNPAHREDFVLRMTKRSTLHMSRGRFEFEDGWREERVWCVRTRTKNIITRRGGKVLVMGNCEGFDCPAVEGCILARPTKSLSLYLQCAGRALRPAPGKLEAIILDHAGCALEHGLPQDDREYSLEGKKRRAKSGISVKECPKCFAACASTAKTCFFCGHPFVETASDAGEPLRERDGTLVEMRANSLAMLQRQTATVRHELQAWATRVDGRYGLESGTTNGRCKRVFRKPRSEMTSDELARVRAWFLAEEPWLEAPVAPMSLPLRFEAPSVSEVPLW